MNPADRHACTIMGTGDERIAFATDTVAPPGGGQVRVRTRCSGISAGTELLYYRGALPEDSPEDRLRDPYYRPPAFPIPLGYCAVGVVDALGPGVDDAWLNARVFAFHPHADYFTVPVADLLRLPDIVTDEAAVFLANMETAVCLVMDAHPRIGERAIVFGLGVVGLLATSLLARFPLETLVGVDALPHRRAAARRLGADETCSPGAWSEVIGTFADPAGADFAIEVSGNPDALDAAIAGTGYAGRVVVGSWYGDKTVSLQLGGRFHRSRQTLVSSQVSTIPPHLAGRWSKQRRMHVALEALARVDPVQLITHRFPFAQAQEAYDLIATAPSDAIQTVLTYPESDA